MNPPPIRTKRQFVREYQKGTFGNRAPTWNTLAEFQASGYRGLVHIRNRVAGGPTWYDIPAQEVAQTWTDLVRKGIKADSLYLSGMAPHHKGTIQGEIRRDELWLTLTYCSAKLPMRESMANGASTAHGLAATMMLRHYMDPASFDWVMDLLDMYPDHVIEFSCFSIPWGTIPNRNTVVWEVRQY